MTLQSLLERVEGASGPDRLLDVAICRAMNKVRWRHSITDEQILASAHMDANPPEPLTASLDAALALVERVRPGRQWQVNGKSDGTAFGVVETTEPGNRFQRHDAATPALALLSALLRSLIAETSDAR